MVFGAHGGQPRWVRMDCLLQPRRSIAQPVRSFVGVIAAGLSVDSPALDAGAASVWIGDGR